MGQDQTEKLTELQKQIVNATWKLQREGTGSANKSRGSSEGKNPPSRSTGSSGDESRSPTPGRKRSYAVATSFNKFAHVAGQLAASSSTDADEDVARTSGRKAAGSKDAAPSLDEDIGVVLQSQAQAPEQAKRPNSKLTRLSSGCRRMSIRFHARAIAIKAAAVETSKCSGSSKKWISQNQKTGTRTNARLNVRRTRNNMNNCKSSAGCRNWRAGSKT